MLPEKYIYERFRTASIKSYLFSFFFWGGGVSELFLLMVLLIAVFNWQIITTYIYNYLFALWMFGHGLQYWNLSLNSCSLICCFNSTFDVFDQCVHRIQYLLDSKSFYIYRLIFWLALRWSKLLEVVCENSDFLSEIFLNNFLEFLINFRETLYDIFGRFRRSSNIW